MLARSGEGSVGIFPISSYARFVPESGKGGAGGTVPSAHRTKFCNLGFITLACELKVLIAPIVKMAAASSAPRFSILFFFVPVMCPPENIGRPKAPSYRPDLYESQESKSLSRNFLIRRNLVVIASKSRLLVFSHPPPGTIAELPAHHAAYLMFNFSMKFGRYRHPRLDPGLSLGCLPKSKYGWYYRQSNYNMQIQSQNRIFPTSWRVGIFSACFPLPMPPNPEHLACWHRPMFLC
jgi:hypothetical protein